MKKIVSAAFAAALFAASCGGSDADSSSDTTAPSGGGSNQTQPDNGGSTDPGGGDDDNGNGTSDGGQIFLSVPPADNYDPNAIFRWGYTVEATSLDPHRGSSGFDQNWLLPTYDRLVYIAPDGTAEPMLATEWSLSDDGSQLTFELREGVTFHDGAEFNAEAAVASLERARADDLSTVQPVFESVSSIEATGDYSIVFNLSGPPGSLIADLGDRAGMIISPDALDNDDLDRQPVGAGPYRVTNYLLGDRVVYEKFDGYWDPEIQRTAGMEILIMSADETRFNAVRAGEINVALARESQIETGLANGLYLLEGPTPNFYSIAVNSSIPPFDDPLVRRALDYAIPREAIAEGIFGGHCQPTRQPFPETSWAFNADIGHGLEVHDMEEARRLLAEAGYADGFEFSAATSQITGYTTLAEVLQATYAELGITMNLDISDQVSQLFAVDKSHPMVVGAYAPTADPSGVFNNAYGPEALNNPGELSNDELNALAQEGLESLNVEDRAPIYQEMAEVMMTMDSHYYPICMRTRQEFFVPGTTGISIYTSGARDWRGVAIAAE